MTRGAGNGIGRSGIGAAFSFRVAFDLLHSPANLNPDVGQQEGCKGVQVKGHCPAVKDLSRAAEKRSH